MIIKVSEQAPLSSIRQLLAYATDMSKVEAVYQHYIEAPNYHLFTYSQPTDRDNNHLIVGCIGVKIDDCMCEIKHLAVSPYLRRNGIATQMIDSIRAMYTLKLICAETDHDAVQFYRRYGFTIKSLGEKYVGVERFYCELVLES